MGEDLVDRLHFVPLVTADDNFRAGGRTSNIVLRCKSFPYQFLPEWEALLKTTTNVGSAKSQQPTPVHCARASLEGDRDLTRR